MTERSQRAFANLSLKQKLVYGRDFDLEWLDKLDKDNELAATWPKIHTVGPDAETPVTGVETRSKKKKRIAEEGSDEEDDETNGPYQFGYGQSPMHPATFMEVGGNLGAEDEVEEPHEHVTFGIAKVKVATFDLSTMIAKAKIHNLQRGKF